MAGTKKTLKLTESPITVAVDAMGGDFAPDEIIQGAAQLSLERDNIFLNLVGDSELLSRKLARLRHDPERISLTHANGMIAMDAVTGTALGLHPGSSIAVAAQLVAAKKADVLVSAGHTGAAVMACAEYFKKIAGVKRAPLCAVFPTEIRHGEKEDPFSLILDVGATLDVTADDLVTFAILGAAYAAHISQSARPKVALLSNGAEAGRGPKEVVLAHRYLSQATDLNFIGNIEGVDIPRGAADVIVCAGFVGNVVLKMLEGVSETVVRLATYAHKERFIWRAGLFMLSSGIKRLKALTDWEEYGGAPILGFDRLFIKAHGRSRARAIRNACRVAAKAARADLPKQMEAALSEYSARRERLSDRGIQ